MFDTVLAGKTGVVHVRYVPEDATYQAIVTVDGKTVKVQDTDMVVLFKMVRDAGATDKLAMIAMRKFISASGAGIRELSQQRRDFLKKTKSAFASIKAKSKMGKKPVKKSKKE